MIPENEITWSAVTAGGPGGQHVNRSQTAVQLRFDIHASSLPESVKERLLASGDNRITREGVVIILAQEHRSQLRNRQAALQRLEALISGFKKIPKTRRPTRATRAAKERRLKIKQQKGQTKALRGKVPHPD